MANADTFTFTNHVSTCTLCGEKFRASQEAIDAFRASGPGTFPGEEVLTDAELGTSMDFCLDCVAGTVIPEEKAGL